MAAIGSGRCNPLSPSEVVVLSEQSSHLTGGAGPEALITQVDDQLDRLSISVDAPSAGWRW